MPGTKRKNKWKTPRKAPTKACTHKGLLLLHGFCICVYLTTPTFANKSEHGPCNYSKAPNTRKYFCGIFEKIGSEQKHPTEKKYYGHIDWLIDQHPNNKSAKKTLMELCQNFYGIIFCKMEGVLRVRYICMGLLCLPNWHLDKYWPFSHFPNLESEFPRQQTWELI